MPKLTGLDHLVLTVVGMAVQVFHPADGSTRQALRFGAQKINLHPATAPFDPKAARPLPGGADLCFLSDAPLADWTAHFARLGVATIAGPVPRSGATGPLLSLYIRDPDGNLIEVANRVGARSVPD